MLKKMCLLEFPREQPRLIRCSDIWIDSSMRISSSARLRQTWRGGIPERCCVVVTRHPWESSCVCSLVNTCTTGVGRQTEDRVNDSLVLRWFCRVYFEHVPDDTTLLRWAQLIRPETMHALNDRVVELAVQAKVIKGRKLREDWYLCPDQHPSSD